MNVRGIGGVDSAKVESSYWKWVERLGEHYFNHQMAGRPVRLYWPADGELDKEAFLYDIRAYNMGGNPVTVANNLLRVWNPKTGGLLQRAYRAWDGPLSIRHPAYLPYLVAFSLAWDAGGDYSPSNYYSRLNNEVFKLNRIPISTSEFKLSKPLWLGLEEWSEEVLGGQRGIFKANHIGHNRWVGYPLSQVVLRAADRQALPEIFTSLGLCADDCLEDSEIKSILLQSRKSFSTFLERGIERGRDLLMSALCEEFRVELAHFDSTSFADLASARMANRSSSIGLACTIGLASIRSWSFANLSDEPPVSSIRECGYLCDASGDRTVLWQDGAVGWEPDPVKFHGFSPLGQQIVLSSDDGHNILWRSHDIRFLSSAPGSPSSFVETNHIPESAPCLVLVRSSQSKKFMDLGMSAPLSGPCWKGCALHQCDDLNVLRDLYPNRRHLRMPDPIRITGGLRVRRHESAYFKFALPRVEAMDGWKLDVTGARLLDNGNRLVDPSCSGQHVVLQVRRIEDSQFDTLRSKQLTVEEYPSPDTTKVVPFVQFEGLDSEVLSYNSRDNDPFEIDSDVGVGCRILQVLSTWGECSYRVFKNACKEINPNSKPNILASNLMLLGHIDLTVNSDTGLWRTVAVRQGVLRVLPARVRAGGGVEWHQAVLEGQFDWANLSKRLDSITATARVDVHGQPGDSVDSVPRVRIMAEHPNDLAKAASQLGVQLVEGLPCVGVRRLCGVEGFNGEEWYEGDLNPTPSTHFFSPIAMTDIQCNDRKRLERLELLSGGLLLVKQDQEYDFSHTYLCLGGKRRKLSPLESREARWLCFRETANEIARMWRFRPQSGGRVPDDATSPPLPYDPITGQLSIPGTLVPPDTIGRLLVACSGMLPSFIERSKSSLLATFGIESLGGPFPQDLIPSGTPLLGYDFVTPALNAYVQYILGMTDIDKPSEGVR